MKTKNYYGLMAMAIAMMTAGCTQEADEFGTEEQGEVVTTFAVGGDFELPAFKAMTRGELTADGKAMTDLWVLDYKDGSLVQQLHQTSDDEDFGSPTLALSLGQHHIYFVCSRGTEPTLSTDDHTIVWATTSDTFYKDYSANVTSGSTASRSVTLDRVATKLGITIADAIPTGTAYVEITPATWYYGIDYLTGEATAAQTAGTRTINIPESRIGKTGTNLNIFGLSGATEWTTDVTVTARDGEDNVLGTATISGAPFKANRATTYSGSLFSAGGGFAMTLTDSWDDDYLGSW